MTTTQRPLSVLVVDDHPDSGESCADLLRLYGHDARVARTAAEALAALDAFTPDVALLDIGLPGVDGFELARRLVAFLPRRPLLVSVTGFPHLEVRSRESGFDHHFLKPFDPERLVRALEGGRVTAVARVAT
ncbi:response regulator [bacterium]|nr:response regulator [bacterium]